MKSIFLPLLLMAISAPAAAAWHNLAAGQQMTLDAEEPKKLTPKKPPPGKEADKDRKLQIWSKTTFTQAEQARPGDFFYSASKTMTEINCTAGTVKPLERVYYGDDGKEVKIVRYSDTDPGFPPVPDSEEDKIYNFACAPTPPAPPAAAVAPKAGPAAPRPRRPAAKTAKKSAAPAMAQPATAAKTAGKPTAPSKPSK